MQAAAKVGISVPRPIGLGVEEGHSCILLSYVEGAHGTEADAKSRAYIWEKLGEYARKLHAVPVTGFDEHMVSPGVFSGSWSAYLACNIDAVSRDDALLKAGLIDTAEVQVLKESFAQAKDSFFRFGLIHNDLSLKNTIVSPDGVVYLLDWGSAGADVVPHMDFAEVLYASLRETDSEFADFLQGYGMSKEEFEEMKPDMWRLQLLRLTDKVRWAIDRRPELIERKVSELKKGLAAAADTLGGP